MHDALAYIFICTDLLLIIMTNHLIIATNLLRRILCALRRYMPMQTVQVLMKQSQIEVARDQSARIWGQCLWPLYNCKWNMYCLEWGALEVIPTYTLKMKFHRRRRRHHHHNHHHHHHHHHQGLGHVSRSGLKTQQPRRLSSVPSSCRLIFHKSVHDSEYLHSTDTLYTFFVIDSDL